MKNIFLILIILFVSVSSLFAVPAVPWAVEKVQPDGTKISVFLKGDEYVNWMESADGYTLMYDSLKYVVYAQTDGQGNLVPSNIRFGSNTQPNANIAKGLRYSKSQINTLRQIDQMTKSAIIQRTTTGNVRVLCILAAFKDKAFVKIRKEFEDLMNQVGYSTGGAKGSVRDFYLENSYGLMDLQVEVIGPVTVSNKVAYYGYPNNWSEFAYEVVDQADKWGVDYSQFATNGQVESFHIIFAGYGDEVIGDHQQIWSHEGNLGTTVTKDGVRLFNYSCSPELRGSSGSDITYIGAIAHEMAHVLGSPDYYDTTQYPIYTGSGDWDLMAHGVWNDDGRQPAHINPFQKIQFGWITPQTLTVGNKVSNMPPSANNAIVYKIMANSNGEHYLLENRQRVGFDALLPGHGLLIWHIAESASNYNMHSQPNNTHPQQVYPVCASSTMATPIPNTPSSYGDINSAGCPFPGTSGKTVFTDSSTPRAFTWTGLGGGIGTPIKNIIENANQTVSFSLCVAPTTVNFTGPIDVSANTTKASCGDINVQYYVTVINGATLILDAEGNINIQDVVDVKDGSTMTSDAGGDINVRDMYVNSNSKLILKAAGNIDIQDVHVIYGSTVTSDAGDDINVREVYVKDNSSLILKAAGETTIERDFEVELGSEFEIKSP